MEAVLETPKVKAPMELGPHPLYTGEHLATGEHEGVVCLAPTEYLLPLPPTHTPAPGLSSPVSTLHWGLPAASARASYLQSLQEVGEDVGGRSWDLAYTLTGTVTLE